MWLTVCVLKRMYVFASNDIYSYEIIMTLSVLFYQCVFLGGCAIYNDIFFCIKKKNKLFDTVILAPYDSRNGSTTVLVFSFVFQAGVSNNGVLH